MVKRREKQRKSMNEKCVVIAGIGTGGHYFPASVVAQELRNHNMKVIFLVRAGKAEEKLAAKYSLTTFRIQAHGFFGKSLYGKCLSILSIALSVVTLLTLTKKVIGVAFGGFGSIPLIIACLINRSPFFLFEPNRIPGRTTILFAKKAECVFLGLPLVVPLDARCEITGIPMRSEFKKYPIEKKTRNSLQKRALFLGGSQGARRLNELALKVREQLPDDYFIVIVSGKRDFNWVSKEQDSRTKVIAFTFTPWQEMREADIIISRSGALAGYEVMTSGKPVIFIPFPYAIDDHQYYNAEYFTQTGNAIILREESLSEQKLAHSITTHIHARGGKANLVMDAEQRITDAIVRRVA